MNRQEYLDDIKEKLLGLSEEDIDKALEFYMEALDDRIDDGLTEEQAINAVGTADEVAEQILMDTPLPKLVSATVKPKRALKAWEIVLLVLGAPLWIPIVASLFAVALSVVCVLFSLMLTVIAVVFGSIVGGFVAVIAGITGLIAGGGFAALAKIGGGLVVMGLGALLFLPCKSLVLWLFELCGRFFKWIKKQFIKKKNVKD